MPDNGFPNPINTANFANLVETLFRILQRIAIAVLALVLVYAGYLFSTAQGDPEKVERAKKAIFWSIVGVGIVTIGRPLARMIINALS